MAKHMLTTIDNPNNPFTEPDEWEKFDRLHGYGTVDYMGRIAQPLDNLSEEELDEERERVIQEILDNDLLGIYIRVTKDSVIHPINLEVLINN